MRNTFPAACFFVSGAAGLIYEVCWIRRASLVFGSTIFALSTVLAVFFLGLAIGSYAFGRLSQRTERPLLVYAFVEVLLALLALASLPALDLVGRLYGPIYRSVGDQHVLLAAARVALVALVLCPPAILMGGTLPLFCRHFVVSRGRILGSVGFLYGVNTLGAAVGCAAAGFVLIPSIGVRGAVLVGALLNVAAGATMWRLRPPRPAEKTPEESHRPPPAQRTSRAEVAVSYRPTILAPLVFVAGFVGLGYEVLWTRFLALIVNNTVYTYTLTLTVTLIGIVLGSLLASRFMDRPRARAVWLGLLQVSIGLSVLSVLLLPPAIWWRLGDGLSTYALLLVPSAVLGGALFPLAVRIAVDDPARAGIGVGRITAVNTMGGIAGSLVTGFVALPIAGLQASALAITGLSLAAGCTAWLVLERGGARRLRLVAAAASVLAWAALPMLVRTRIPADFLVRRGQLEGYREGLMSNLAVVRRDGVRVLEIDTWWQGQDRKTHQIMAAHLPMLLHPDPRRVLVVGAGAGQTPARVTMYPVDRLDCVDIEPAVFDLIRSHFESSWMNDPRVHLIREDGRNYITHTHATYDVIALEVGQLIRPGVPNFYTKDFYQLARSRLAPGGILSQFVPIQILDAETLRGVVATFLAVFPNSSLWYNRAELLLVGANRDDAVLDRARLDRLESNPRVHDDLRYSYWGGPALSLNQPRVLLGGYLMGHDGLAALTAGAPIYRDDPPTLEYRSARPRGTAVREFAALELLRPHLDPVEAIARPALPPDTVLAIREIRDRNLAQIRSEALLRQLAAPGAARDKSRPLAIATEALRVNPDYPRALRIVADLLLQAGRLDEAEADYRRALAMEPDDPLSHLGLAHLLEQENRIAEAIPHHEAVLALGFEDELAHRRLADTYAHRGDYAAALPHLEAVVRLRPDDQVVRRDLESVREALRQGAAP